MSTRSARTLKPRTGKPSVAKARSRQEEVPESQPSETRLTNASDSTERRRATIMRDMRYLKVMVRETIVANSLTIPERMGLVEALKKEILTVKPEDSEKVFFVHSVTVENDDAHMKKIG